MIKDYDGIKPIIDNTAYISQSVDLIGKVELNEYSSIWYNSVIRGDIEAIKIGAYSNVQDGSVLHTSNENPVEIGKYVTIGHKVILHGCKIKDYSLIGMGSIVLDGAIIESNVLLGAGSLVPPGKIIPEGSLAMGSPAKVVRKLTEKEIQHIKENALEYVELAKKHQK